MDHETKIIVFCCNWCSYAAADLAGVKRIQYPYNIRIVRVMCSGMVHPQYVVDTLMKGADGVMVLGCHLGECHYQKGNHLAQERSELIKELLDDFGFERERFMLNWVSSAEPGRFVELLTKMCERVAALQGEAVVSDLPEHG